MFAGCTNLTTAPELPAITLTNNCYENMFYGCTKLSSAPVLPATTLTNYCYREMFYGCTSLTQAPELPATTLANNCYQYMFNRCNKIDNIKVSITEWHENATDNWLWHVSETGFFEGPMELAVERGENRIPEGWNIFKVNLLTDTIKSPDNLSAYYIATINGKNIPDFNKLLISSNVNIDTSTSGILIFDENVNVRNVEILFKYPCCEEIISSIIVEEEIGLFNVSLNKNTIDFNEPHDWYFTDGLIKHTIYYSCAICDESRINSNNQDFLNSEPINLKSNDSLEIINHQTNDRTKRPLGCLHPRVP